MIKEPKIAVIVPAYNEVNSIARVVNDIPKDLVDEVKFLYLIARELENQK